MALNLTVATWDDRVVTIQVEPSLEIETVKAVVEAETGIPADKQILVFGTKILTDKQTLVECGVSDGDLLQVMLKQVAQQAGGRQQQQQPSAEQRQQQQAMAMNPDGSAVSPVAFIQAVKGNPSIMGPLRVNNPMLAQLIQDEDVSGLQDLLRRSQTMKSEAEKRMRENAALLAADPFDIEAQKRIEEDINKQNIQENLELAQEHSPEVFGQVIMLYVDMTVNDVPVKAFVDSGAQITIMTQEFAEFCHLSRLIDKRFEGMAVGVGSSKIIGRIHQAPLRVAGNYIASSITVLEQKSGPQFIFGLDNMKKHQCCIDLKSNVLKFGSCPAELPFLPEHEIPNSAKQEMADLAKASAESSAMQTDGPVASSSASAGAGAAAGTAQQPQAAQAASAQESKVQQLMSLGFTQAECMAALAAAEGNEDAAASILLGM